MAFGRPKKLKVGLAEAIKLYWADYMPLKDRASEVLTQDNFKLSYYFGRCRIDPQDTDDWNVHRARSIFKSILDTTKGLPGKKRARVLITWTTGGATGNMGLRNHVAIGKTEDHHEECDTVDSIDSWMRRNRQIADRHFGVDWQYEIREGR